MEVGNGASNYKIGDLVCAIGLGHMGMKFTHALGANVVMITTSPEKGKDVKRLGAHEVLVSKDADDIKKHQGSFDLFLNTITVEHEIDPYLGLLKLRDFCFRWCN